MLDDFNRQCKDGASASDHVFEEFVAQFSLIGRLDFCRNWLTHNWKPEILTNVARGHMSSLDSGRNYLNGKEKDALRKAENTALEILPLLFTDDRREMLKTADFGERGQIFMRFPDIDLRVPLGKECFEDRDRGLKQHEIEKLFVNQEGTSPSMFERFARQFDIDNDDWGPKNPQILDQEACSTWSTAINRWLGDRPIANLVASGDVMRALGVALRTLGWRAATFEDNEDLKFGDLLRKSAEAFYRYGSTQAYCSRLVEIGELYARAGDSKASTDAYRYASDKLGNVALATLRHGEKISAEICREAALKCFDVLGERVRHDTEVTNQGEKPARRSDGFLGCDEFEWKWNQALSGRALRRMP
ncbi:hypothetical protein [Pandoraea aquatica]|uniref:hypothetical protein n=1 Tax=Pandoraea aquatica TaxID=2508290 RepID=UPI00124008E7|nr:hypothetical protein [Pandoraea aquatica]